MCIPSVISDIKDGSPSKASNKSKLIVIGGTAAAVIGLLVAAVIVLAVEKNSSDGSEPATEVSTF